MIRTRPGCRPTRTTSTARWTRWRARFPNCTHYASSSKDALGTVIDWYKKALPNAKLEDVNKDSLYGNYFKLDGVKLLVGNDIVNVYRTPDMHLPYLKKEDLNRTSIEIFKCNDASRPKQD